MITKLVFMLFIYIAAWQDLRSGEVDLRLLAASSVITAALSYNRLHILSAAIVFAVFLIMELLKKVGGADNIIFTQTALLFGFLDFAAIAFIASVIGILWVLYTKLRTGIYERSVRFIPFIAVAAQIVFITSSP